jgi:hypothetical protein
MLLRTQKHWKFRFCNQVVNESSRVERDQIWDWFINLTNKKY